MNKFKRMFSCMCVLALSIMTYIGLPANATSTTLPKTAVTDNSNSPFYFFSGHMLENNNVSSDNTKLADHYSHESHSSHQSGY